MAGAEWDRQEIEERRDGTQTTLATGAVSKTLLGETFPLRDLPRSTTDEVGLYAQNEIAYGMVTLIPGVRWDFYRLDAQTDAVFADAERLTDLQHDRLSLRLGATVQPWTPLTLYANYAQGFRAPPAEDVNLFLDLPQFGVVSLPNPDLEPERSDTIEAGLRWHEAGVAVEASGYYATYDDFIQSRSRLGTDPESGLTVFQSRNLESATIYGAEAFARLALYRLSDRLAPWTIDAGLHWAEGENDRTDEPLNDVAPLKLIANLRWQSTHWPIESGLRVTHLARKSDVDRTAGDVFVAPDATLLDLTTRWQPNERFDLVLGVYNLTNERYWRYADVRHFEPGDPRIEVASQPGIHADLTVNVRF